MRYYYILLITLSLFACNHAIEKYSDKYDYIDIDGILANDRLRTQYYNCFMDQGPCLTPDAEFFKTLAAEAIATNCKKCTDFQRQAFDKVADWYTRNDPDKWKAFVEKFINSYSDDKTGNNRSNCTNGNKDNNGKGGCSTNN